MLCDGKRRGPCSMIVDTHNRFPVMRIAIVIIAVIASAAAFKWMRGILTPFAIALFLLLIGYGPEVDALSGHPGQKVGLNVPPTIGDLIQQLNPPKYVATVADSLRSVA